MIKKYGRNNVLFVDGKMHFLGQDYPELMSIKEFKRKRYSLLKRIFGIEEYIITKDYEQYLLELWEKWLDTRWTNATMMCGSYDNVPLDLKKQCMRESWNQGIKWGIARDFMLEKIGKNNFGWHPDKED